MSGVAVRCEKRPATGSTGMVVTNHPLASAAGAEILAAGGNAVDAAIGALFTLNVVEPMMVGILGGGMAHLRLPDGRQVVVDGQSCVPGAATPTLYTPVRPDAPHHAPDYLDTVGRKNMVGALAVAVPGSLRAWCATLREHGTWSLADVMAAAIRHAERGFRVTPYLANIIADAAGDIPRDAALAARLMPGGTPLRAGDRFVQGDTADTFRTIARDGEGALHGGPLGAIAAAHLQKLGGIVSPEDIAGLKPVMRDPIRARYRGFEVTGPPPPSAAGVHVAQMLAILEGYDLRALGFGTAETLHLLAEAMKIAFADRAAATADPAFVDVPIARLIDPAYAAERRGRIRTDRAQAWSSALRVMEPANTTHLTVADKEGRVVASTQTINATFGARVLIPELGLIPNNYMANYDPRPGHALSVEPGKRVTSSMSPLIVLRDGKPAFALGLPGGLRIFTSAMQAVINLIDHGMTLQEAVEAPRMWTQGGAVELEVGFAEEAPEQLAAMGHEVARVAHVGGGMNAIAFDVDGTMTGAACWRADGTPIGVGGGLSRRDVKFWPDAQTNTAGRA